MLEEIVRSNVHTTCMTPVMYVLVTALITIAESAPPPGLTRQNPNMTKALEILENTPLVDGHNDLAMRIYENARNDLSTINLNEVLTEKWPISHTDIPRLQGGHVGAQFWASYVACQHQYKDAVAACLVQVDVIKRFVDKYPATFELVTTARGIERAFEAGKIGSMISLESGHCIDSSLAILRMFYDLGVRSMTLTHHRNTPWADSWLVDKKADSEQIGGLSQFGEEVVHEMNRLGMLVDLSHVSKATMLDTLRVTQAPVIFSHSSAFTYCNHYRNVQDDVLRLMKRNGGVVMVTFFSDYINCGPNLQDTATMSQVADHIDHIKNVAGVDHVGIGGDYDGVNRMPVGLEDVSKYPQLIAELIQRGWSDTDLKKLTGSNLLRVFTEVEQVAARLQATREPSDVLVPDEDLPKSSCRVPYEQDSVHDVK